MLDYHKHSSDLKSHSPFNLLLQTMADSTQASLSDDDDNIS